MLSSNRGLQSKVAVQTVGSSSLEESSSPSSLFSTTTPAATKKASSPSTIQMAMPSAYAWVRGPHSLRDGAEFSQGVVGVQLVGRAPSGES